jgi:N-acetylglucosamine-6-phosphate deacetylase
MIRGVRTMVDDADVPLVEAIRMATLNPANALRLQGKGVLKEGADADLVVLSETLEVEATYVHGKPVHTRL